jgi:hypothetical protein
MLVAYQDWRTSKARGTAPIPAPQVGKSQASGGKGQAPAGKGKVRAKV